ncbi:MAG: VPS10 domain-containing protein, partial [Chloroflexus sp.]
VADGTRVMRSEDGGKTWQEVTGAWQGALSAFAPSTYHIDVVWAGTDTGQIWRSDDRGRTWQQVGSIPSPVRCLAAVRVA